MKRLAMLVACLFALTATAPKVGVYYFSGWSNDPFNAADSWAKIRPYPEREPLIGWYRGSDRAVVQQQADWMQAAHLDFVVFDWYYEKGKVQLGGPLDAYLALSSKRPKVSLLWANHGAHTTAATWHAIVAAWARTIARADVFRIGGANVIFVFDAQRFADDAKADGAGADEWLAYAQAEMRRRGLPPIHFVGGVYGGEDTIIPAITKLGFASITAYNMHRKTGSTADAKGYPALDDAYRANWRRMLRFTPALKPILPMISGWDHAPWGAQPARDGSIATAAQFRAHLAAAREVMAANRLDAGVICCWNEYGEGSFIEPTKGAGTAMIDTVAATFPR